MRYHDNLNLVKQYDGQNHQHVAVQARQGACGNWSAGSAECSHAHRFENNKRAEAGVPALERLGAAQAAWSPGRACLARGGPPHS